MGRPFAWIEVRTAAEGLKAEITMSPSLRRALLESDQVEFDSRDGVLMFELREGLGKTLEYQLAKLSFTPGNDELTDDVELPPEYDDDEGLRFQEA